MPAPLSTLALATGGALLGKFVGPAAEHLGKRALERTQQLGTKATALLAAVGRESQPVEPKLLVPLVQAAALERAEHGRVLWRGHLKEPHPTTGLLHRMAVYRLDDGRWDCYREEELQVA